MRKFIGELVLFVAILLMVIVNADIGFFATDIRYDDFITMLNNNEFSEVIVRPNQYDIIGKEISGGYCSTDIVSFVVMDTIVRTASSENPDLKYVVDDSKEISSFGILWRTFVIFMIAKTFVKAVIHFLFKNKNKGKQQERFDVDDEEDEEESEDSKKNSETRRLIEALKSFPDSTSDFVNSLRPATKVETRFSDVIGLENQMVELKDIVSFLKNPEKYKRMGAKIPKGILLYGSSGTGKTLIAKAIAGEADVPFFSISASQVQSEYLGASERNIRKLFEMAKKKAPAIIFFDELDSIATERYSGMSNKYAASVLNQLLACMDGFEDSNGVIVIAATNHREVLDKAVLRSGRFDRHIYIPLPDKAARLKLVDYYMRDKYEYLPNNYFELWENIASITTGFSGADIKNLINEATIITVRRGDNIISMENVQEAFRKITVGIQNGRVHRSEEEKRIKAVHEAGHAIVSRLLGKTPIEISIISRSDAGGYNLFAGEEKGLYTIEDILKEVKCCLGGRAAEKVVFDKISSGASGDLKHVSEILEQMYLAFGMSPSDEVGLVVTRQDQMNNAFVQNIMSKIDSDIKENYSEVVSMLTEHKDILNTLAEQLYNRETLMGDEIEELFNALCI